MSRVRREIEAAAEYVDPETLRPWDRNPRRNQPVDGVARSIRKLGFGAPIVARRQDRRIIAGHTRWKAVELLRKQRAAEGDTPLEKLLHWNREARAIAEGRQGVPVRFVDVSESEASALALADNRLAEDAEWNDDLGAVLRELQTAGDIDLDLLGWGQHERVALLDRIGLEDVKWKEFDETIDDNAHKKLITCPSCGTSFEP